MTTAGSVSVSGTAATELAELVERLTARVKVGEVVDLDELVRDHPAHADQLRRLLPAMKTLADLSAAPEAGSGRMADGGLPLAEPLGDFRLVREVGRGGMGVVYEAEQLSLGRRVALKVLPFAATMDPKQLQRFRNEAKAAASLHHEHVVPVYGVGCERGVHYYAMQFIDGTTVAELIAAQRDEGRGMRDEPKRATASLDSSVVPHPSSLPTAPVAALSTRPDLATGRAAFRQAADWIAQAADALEYAHSMGIVHRDVKPGNLMVDGSGKLWVADFGLARFGPDTGLTMTGDLLGTLRYMAPEQALAKHGLADHRVDVYGLGCTLYELLTGKPAVGGEDKADIVRRIAFEEPVAPRKLDKAIPAELETIALKCLSKNPAERYATAGELAADLRRFVEDKPIKAKPPGLTQRSRTWARRHKAVVVTAAAGFFLATALVAGGIGWVLRDRAARQGKIRADVQRALDEATRRQADGKWADALAAVRVADGLLPQGDEDRGLRGRLEVLRRNLHMVQRLEDIWLGQSNVDEDGTFARSSSDTKYAAAFQEYEIDVDALGPEDAARRVAAQAIRVQLVSALDDWTRIRWAIAIRTNQTGNSWRRLMAVAKAADSDAWRSRVRDALVRELYTSEPVRDPKAPSLPGKRALPGLAELAASEEAADQPSMSVINLSRCLMNWAQDGYKKATALLRNAQRRHPTDFWINFDLGDCYHYGADPRQFEEAIRFYSVAIALRPESPVPPFFLGQVLMEKGRYEEAVAAFKERLRLMPGKGSGLGYIVGLFVKAGRVDEAVSILREAVRLKAERLVSLDGKLPSVLSGKATPTNAAESAALAEVCVEYKRLSFTAYRLYAEAFAGDPKLFEQLHSHRYNAACAAALAGCGQGDDADKLDAAERTRLREQSLVWLIADFAGWTKLADKPAEHARIRQTMQHWLKDEDFAGVRDLDGLAKLPDAERVAWQTLWADVAALLKRTADAPAAVKPNTKP